MLHAVPKHLSSLLGALLRGLFRAWVLALPLVVALSLIRWGQLVYFWPAGYQAASGDVAAALVPVSYTHLTLPTKRIV